MNDTQQYERASRRVLMSKLIKIYDGMTFSLSTGEVLEKGEVTYWDEDDLTLCGGGPSSSTTSSGFATEYKPEIQEMLAESKALYDNDELGRVAGRNEEYKHAINAGKGVAADQYVIEGDMNARTGMTSTEQTMIDRAAQDVDLSGMRAGALQQAQGALNTSQGMAGARGGLGGGRQSLNQASITNDLASKFAGIDQEQQKMQMANLGSAIGAEQGQFNRMGNALSSSGKYADTLAKVGQAEMGYDQKQADSAYTAMAQRVGLFSSVAPKESTTNKTGGK